MKRARRGSIIMAILAVGVLLVSLVIEHSTQAQAPGGQAGGRQGGGRPGGFGRNMRSMIMSPLESSWAYVSFELAVEDSTLIKTKNVYMEFWKKHKKLADDTEGAAGDTDRMQSVRDETEKLRTQRHEKLKDVLPAPKLEQLIKWEAESQRPATQRQRQG